MQIKYRISFHNEKTRKVEVWQFLETPRVVFRQENDWELSSSGLKEYGRNNKAGCEGDFPTAFINISPCQQQSYPFQNYTYHNNHIPPPLWNDSWVQTFHSVPKTWLYKHGGHEATICK